MSAWHQSVNELVDDLRAGLPLLNVFSRLIGEESVLVRPLQDRDLHRADGDEETTAARETANLLLADNVLPHLLDHYRPRDQPQVEHLLAGLIKAQLAATVFHVRPAAADDTFVTLCKESATAFQDAFPGIVSNAPQACWPTHEGAEGKHLADLIGRSMDTHTSMRGIGYFCVRRVIAHLLLNRREVDSEHTLDTPVLLYDQKRGLGVVQRLIGRCGLEGCRGWYPDPVSMAMVALDENFQSGLNRAWETARVADARGGTRSVRIEFDQPVATSIEGKSASAAAACLFHALLCGRQLDSHIAVAAVVDQRSSRLAKVAALKQKLQAADTDPSISTVVVSWPQWDEARRLVRDHGFKNVQIDVARFIEEVFDIMDDRPRVGTPPVLDQPEPGARESTEVADAQHTKDERDIPDATAPVLESDRETTDPTSEQDAPGGDPVPADGQMVVADIPGRLGEYQVEQVLWADVFGTAYWCHRTDTRETQNCVVHHLSPTVTEIVLGDASGLAGVVDRLSSVVGEKGCLLPARIERSDDGRCLLTYPMPAGSCPEEWVPLSSFLADRLQADTGPFLSRFTLLQFGRDIAGILERLHEPKLSLIHGCLTSENVLLHRGSRILLKNTWAAYIPGLLTAITDAGPVDDLLATGRILFQLACGRLPSAEEEAAGEQMALRHAVAARFNRTWANEVPETVYEVISSCLQPVASHRPTAASIQNRLRMAILDPDLSVRFAEYVDGLIQAGHRLFAIETDDFESLENCLQWLASEPRRVRLRSPAMALDQVEYRLLVAEEERGIRGEFERTWVEHDAVDAVFLRVAMEQGRRPDDVPATTADDVAHFNAVQMFRDLQQHQTDLGQESGRIPILLIRGVRTQGPDWWYFGSAVKAVLRRFQHETGAAPVVIVAGRNVTLEEDLKPLFAHLQQPPPPVSSLFEWIWSAGRALDPDFKDSLAVQLAVEMFPCARPQLTQALRVCELQHGEINRSLIASRDLERRRLIEQHGTARFYPPDELPDLACFGLPPRSIILDGEPRAGSSNQVPSRNEIEAWAERIRAVWQTGSQIPIRRMLTLEGPSGCGKTTLAGCLAKLVDLPLVKINLASCLRGDVGGSERALIATLNAVTHLHRAVVLLDGADGVLEGPTGDDSATTAALARMSSSLYEWSSLPVTSGMILILTARDATTLPAQWRMRTQWSLRLPNPVGARLAAYRAAVFSAGLRACGLAAVADDESLAETLASQTDPVLSQRQLLTPDARVAGSRRLRSVQARLESSADIESWLQETIAIHARDGDPGSSDFWLNAL